MHAERGTIHHVELQVLDLGAAARSFGWLLAELGYRPFQRWPTGMSWRLGCTSIVVASARLPVHHDRRGAGLNHLAFHAGTRADVDRLWAICTEHGWNRLYADRHPWAGGADHYAAYLENGERFKVELVAAAPAAPADAEHGMAARANSSAASCPPSA